MSCVINYRTDVFSKMSYADLIKYIPITPELVEVLELNNIGAFHNRDDGSNGVDGYCINTGRAIEIKSQVYKGNYKLHGRGKYNISAELVEKKLRENEKIIIVGICYETGQVYYRFSFDFDAIKEHYMHAVYNTKSDNYDFIPLHYAGHSSFKVEALSSAQDIIENSHKFKPGFLQFLLELSRSYREPK